MKDKKLKHIVILAIPGSTLLSIAGPLEIFAKARETLSDLEVKSNYNYQLHVVSVNTKKVPTSSCLSILTEGNFQQIDYDIDTLIVSGVTSFSDVQVSSEVLYWLKEQSKKVRRICSICTGVLLLAQAGVLSGKKATTHWQFCHKLANLYPDINVEIAPYFLKDGNVYTSAGISSGMDLTLALIEEDLGKEFALQIAKWMVLFLKRPGNQLQFSNWLEYQEINHLSVRTICEWLQNNYMKDIRIDKLAERVTMSPRNFARVFVKELNITPAKYIDHLRVDRACYYLVESQISLDKIAENCGLKNAENLRRLFLKILDTSPSQYRRNFNSSS